MNIVLASDHVGLALKEIVKQNLCEQQIEYIDYGCFSKERVDYPLYAYQVANAVSQKKFHRGLLFCGTGVGMAIAANKINHIRAVVCSDCYTAEMSRKHNDTNILALGARVLSDDQAIAIVNIWLNGRYEFGRHDRRLQMIA